MSSLQISNRIVSNGLEKARREFCSEALSLATFKIQQEPLSAPENVQEWRKGSFQWVFVRGVEYWANWFFREIESDVMARKSSNAKKSRGLEAYSFVRCELSAEDKKAAKVWIEENTSDMAAIVHDVVASDYKISCSFSSDHDTFTVSLTGKEGSLNEYKTLTARHRDWVVATMTVMYKHSVMFGSKVWESDDTEDDGWS